MDWISRVGVTAASWVSSRPRSSAARAATSASGIGPVLSVGAAPGAVCAWPAPATARTRPSAPANVTQAARMRGTPS